MVDIDHSVVSEHSLYIYLRQYFEHRSVLKKIVKIRFSGRLQEVVAYENQTTGHLLWKWILTHLQIFGMELLHTFCELQLHV